MSINMSRIENYNESKKKYLLHCIRGVVDTVENPPKKYIHITIVNKTTLSHHRNVNNLFVI